MAREVMMKRGYDPVEELVTMAQDPNTPFLERKDIASFLAPFMYPKLSAIEMAVETGSTSVKDAQSEIMRRIMENPELADAAQRISLMASDVILGVEAVGVEGRVQ